jgi:hypothetical protein
MRVGKMNLFRSGSLWCGLLLLSSALLAGDARFEEIDFSPNGRPEKMDHRGPNIYLWRMKDGFHLKTTGKDKDHSTLSGEIRVEGGKFVNVRNLENLEGGRRKRQKNVDIGWISPEKLIIRFKFVTAGLEDGFDFDVEGENATVKFDLNTDGTGETRRIHIGKEGKHPPGMKFLVPARARRNSAK